MEAGFNDLSYFNRAFRRRYGASPSTCARRQEQNIAARVNRKSEPYGPGDARAVEIAVNGPLVSRHIKRSNRPEICVER